jgi:polysaccharide export outer membrane protein
MRWVRSPGSLLPLLAFLIFAMSSQSGCHLHRKTMIAPTGAPNELAKQRQGDYIIEPPDILDIDVIQAIPKPPFKIQTLDTIGIRVLKALPDEPIADLFVVDPDGTVNLGASYGTVKVVGLTIEEAKEEVIKKLQTLVDNPVVSVVLAQTRGVQQIRGPHLVRPDGTVSLGSYGSVSVVGMRLSEAKAAIEAVLSQTLQNPEVILDISAYNSKVYYVILDGGGSGQQIVRFPITGNETVLDAIAQVNGLSAVSSTRDIRVVRRASPDCAESVLLVDWKAITECGDVRTNYQLIPGDRVFVKAQKLIIADTFLGKLFAPFERIFGFILLGNGTIRSFQNNGGNGNNGNGNGGFLNN